VHEDRRRRCRQMGGLYAAAFASNGHDVALFDSSLVTVNAINANGLIIERQGGSTERYLLPAALDAFATRRLRRPAALSSQGLWDSRRGGKRLRPLTDAKTVVVTLQNGLGNEEILRDTYPDNQLVLGMVEHTVITIAPGHYRHTGVRDTYLGPSRDEWMDAAAWSDGHLKETGSRARTCRARNPHRAVGQVRGQLRRLAGFCANAAWDR